MAIHPYKVGDRIRIGNVYGDVINVSYIDRLYGNLMVIIFPVTIQVVALSDLLTQKYSMSMSIVPFPIYME